MHKTFDFKKYVEYKVYSVTTIKNGYGFRDEVIGQLHTGIYIVYGKIRVEEFMIFWLEDIMRPRITDDTYTTYKSAIKNYIVPQIGKMYMSTLNQGYIRKLYNAVAEKYESVAKNVRTIMKTSLEYAFNKNVLATNLAKGINLPKKNDKDMLKSLDLPDIHFHQLRNTYATILLKNSFNSKGVSHLLGHKDQEYVKDISIYEITDFPNHPFKVKMDDKMLETIESVRNHGVLVPALVREKPTGGYEMISGHRRKMASELAGFENMPCIVRNLSDDEAVIVMVDSNLQREEILPSEKAFAYKMKLEAMKRQGQRTDLTSSPLATKLKGKRSDELLGEQVGESKDQIRRYIRLTYLIPEILEMVDDKKISMRPAVELSYLPKEEQEILYDTMESEACTPSHAQAIKIRKFSAEGRLNEDVLLSIMAEEKPNQVEQWKIPKNRLKKYFPSGTSQQKMEETIIKALELYRKREKSRER
ncbi:ParB/RepB/Spo0J family partition protein [Dorea sp.]